MKKSLLLAKSLMMGFTCASILALGCGGSMGSLSGKVSFKGTPLKGGNVTFISLDGKPTLNATISENGTYSVNKIPTGAVSICVETKSLRKATQGMNIPKYEPPKGAAVPEGGYKPTGLVDNSKNYMEIPAKYEKPDSSGLKYTVKPGPQVHDIPLD
ncbi:MAG: carboxypeptidase-like regulatory domain-containing protein [Gemmataceae bacterium]